MKILIIIFGVLLYLFSFWKRLKDDYIRNQIFSTAFVGLFFIGAGYSIANYFYETWWFWISLLGGIIGYTVGIFKFKLKILEVLEAATLGLLSLYASFLLSEMVVLNAIPYFIGFVTIVFLIVLFYLLDRHYKSFAWYKSGRIGFSGLTVCGIYFLIHAIVAVSASGVLSFVESKDAILSAILSFTSFLLIINLARQKI